MRFRILHYDILDSTNNLAIAFAREGAEEGTVVCAEYQTHGRGRFNRRWVSPRGKNLLFSIILRPKLTSSEAPILTQWAAQSVAEVLKRHFKLQAKLKRPNDVLVGSKKIAGILTESSAYHHRLEYVVVGFGINVNVKGGKLFKTATSVYLETGKEAEKDKILLEVLEAFRSKYQPVSARRTIRKRLTNKAIL